MSAHLPFRQDINALRAIAVLAVVVFHWDASVLPGGFAGVDVFFVISGYLMTALILKGRDDGNFSLVSFYLARARRIIPALALLVGVLLTFGYAFLLPSDLHALSQQAFSALTFTSNWHFLRETGYFAPAAREQWLLHTWSLSIEWQFYLLYPLLLLTAARYLSRRHVKALLVVITALGFAHNVVITDISPNLAFYAFTSRSWELSLGGLAYAYPVALGISGRRWLARAGWVVLILSLALLHEHLAWPGHLVLLPTLSAGAIILASSPGDRVLGHRAVQAVGKYSYSLYLWHWPLLVASEHINWDEHRTAIGVALVAVSMASFHWLENRRPSLRALLLLVVPVTAASWAIAQQQGLQQRVTPEFRLTHSQYHAQFYGGSGYKPYRIIRMGALNEIPVAILAGDSFGLQYAKSLDRIATGEQQSISGLFDHACLIAPTVTVYSRQREDLVCSAEYDKLRGELNRYPGVPLVLAFSWENYRGRIGTRASGSPIKFDGEEDYHRTLSDELEKLMEHGGVGRQYFVVGAPQTAKSFAFNCLARAQLPGSVMLGDCEHAEPRRDIPVNEALKRLAERRSNLHYIDPDEVLCTGNLCWVIRDGQPVHSDRVHLSVHGADIVANHLARAIGLLEKREPHKAAQVRP